MRSQKQAPAKMRRPLQLLIGCVVAAGRAVLIFGATRYTSDDWGLLLTLILLGALAERYAIGLFRSDISVGVVAVLVAGVVSGPWGVAIVAPTIVLAGQLGTEAAWSKRAYNAAVYLLAGVIFAGIFRGFGSNATPDEWPQVLAPALVGALANYAINSWLVAAAIALSEGEPVISTWRRNYLWVMPQYAITGLASMAIATGYHVMGLWALALFAPPVAGIRHPLHVAPSNPAAAGPMTKPALAAMAIRPNATWRRCGVFRVRSAT